MAHAEMVYRYVKECLIAPNGDGTLLVVQGDTFRTLWQAGQHSQSALYHPSFWRERVGTPGVVIESQEDFWLLMTCNAQLSLQCGLVHVSDQSRRQLRKGKTDEE